MPANMKKTTISFYKTVRPFVTSVEEIQVLKGARARKLLRKGLTVFRASTGKDRACGVENSSGVGAATSEMDSI